MEKELSFKQMMLSPVLKKGKGRNDELIGKFGDDCFRRLELTGIITHTKRNTIYLNDWFLTKKGKNFVDLFDDKYTIFDRISDWFIVHVLFGKTRWMKIQETLNMYK